MLRLDLPFPQQVFHVVVNNPTEAAVVDGQHLEVRYFGKRLGKTLHRVSPQQDLLQLLAVGDLWRQRRDVGLLQVDLDQRGQIPDVGHEDVDLVATDVQGLQLGQLPDDRRDEGHVALRDLEVLQAGQLLHLGGEAPEVLGVAATETVLAEVQPG